MFRRTPRPSGAMIVALVAVVLACAGTATAAKLITGKDIKNSSVTGADIKNSSLKSADVKNGSLSASDLSSGARKALKGDAGATGATGAAGAAGAAGAQGVAGPAGPTGPRGPSDVLAVKEETQQVESDGTSEVLRIAAPAGSHLVFAKLRVRDNTAGATPGEPTCAIGDLIGGDELFNAIDDITLFVPDSGDDNRGPEFTLMGTVTLDAARPIALRCTRETANGQTAIRANESSLVVQQVATVG